MTDLVNKSPVTPMLEEVMGKFQAPTHCQVAWKPVTETQATGEGYYGGSYNVSGYKEKDQPYYGAWLHHDGLCGLTIPQEPVEGSREEVYDYLVNNGPKGDEHGRSPETVGNQFVPLFMDPDMTLSVGSFTTFVIACLSDQTQEGSGQT